MPLLFGIGDKLFNKTARPVRSGTIHQLSYEGVARFDGCPCTVFDGWIVISKDGKDVLIPTSKVESLRLR